MSLVHSHKFAGGRKACVVTTHEHWGALFRLKVRVLRAPLLKCHRAGGPGICWSDLTDVDGKVQNGTEARRRLERARRRQGRQGWWTHDC